MINDHDFFKISKKSNDILDNNNKDIFQSISKLHVIKHHPTYFSDLTGKKNKFYFLKKIINYSMYLLNENKIFYYKSIKETDCVIISNLFGKSVDKKETDLYFGNLKQLLINNKISVCKIYRNLSDKTSKSLFKSNEFDNDIILSKKFYFNKELKYLFKIFESIVKLKIFGKYKFIKQNFKLSDFFSIPHNLRLRDQICELILKIKPKIIIFTFEGHSWERLLIYKLKKISPNTIIAGYQFTSLIKNQNSIYRKINQKFSPDFIFTTGKISENIIKKRISDIKVETIGSAKKLVTDENKIELIKFKKQSILFVPEGLDYEIFKMLNFCIKSAKKFPNINFIFRFHPLINAKNFIEEHSLKDKVVNLKNIIISKKNLAEDLSISNFIVFRGSSIVFNAVLNNKIPLYLNIDEINCNPLYEVFPEKLTINNSDIFQNLEQFNLNENEKLSMKDYCKNYFEEFDINKIKKIINERKKQINT